MPSSRLFSYILIQDLTLSSISLKSAENITGLTVTLTAHGGARGAARRAGRATRLSHSGVSALRSRLRSRASERSGLGVGRAPGGALPLGPAGDALLTDWRYTSVITRHAHYTEYTECFAH